MFWLVLRLGQGDPYTCTYNVRLGLGVLLVNINYSSGFQNSMLTVQKSKCKIKLSFRIERV